jgi:hypothetical protein
MADNIISTFLVALGFDDAAATSMVAKTKKSMADYERAVREAEKRIEDAKWEGAKTQEEIAKLTRETNLKEARAALASAQEREKSEKETARKREERHKEFVAGMSRMALAATAAVTAISYGVNKIASAFDNLGFVSQRTGASVQSLNSLSYAFKQTGGTAGQAIGAVEKFAQALRGNDGLKSFVRGLGVDTSKDMGDVYLNTVDRLSQHPYQVGMREAGMLGISEEDYKLVTDHIGQIRAYRDEYNRTTRSLGVDSQKATEASQLFWRSMTRLEATASALTDKLMISLAPAIEGIVRRINDWIAANPEKVDKIMRGIGEATDAVTTGLTKLADWFGNDENQRAIGEFWEKFNKYVGDSVKSITEILRLLGKLDKFLGLKPGDDLVGVMTSRALYLQSQAGAGEGGGDDRNWWQRHAPRALGGRDAPIPGGTARIGAAARNVNAQTIIGELRRAGYNDNAIAAIVGSMQTESGLNPAVPQNSYNRGHTGLWQWDRTRWPKIAKWISDRGGNPMDAAWQTRAWVAEHNARPGDAIYDHARTQRGGEILRNNPTLDNAIHGVRESERFGPGEEGGRAANARGWLPHVTARPATAAPTTAPAMPRLNMSPGGFDPNRIDPANLLRPGTHPADAITNNSSSRSVVQHISNTTTIHGSDRPQEAARVMESAFGRLHGLALQNAQSAVT